LLEVGLDPPHAEVFGAITWSVCELPLRKSKYTGTPVNTINNPGHVVAVR
jgi:hypothetical protein